MTHSDLLGQPPLIWSSVSLRTGRCGHLPRTCSASPYRDQRSRPHNRRFFESPDETETAQGKRQVSPSGFAGSRGLTYDDGSAGQPLHLCRRQVEQAEPLHFASGSALRLGSRIHLTCTGPEGKISEVDHHHHSDSLDTDAAIGYHHSLIWNKKRASDITIPCSL
jgi:hypothetical protein